MIVFNGVNPSLAAALVMGWGRFWKWDFAGAKGFSTFATLPEEGEQEGAV